MKFKLLIYWKLMRFIGKTVYFNFKYLPVKKAVFLPIVFYCKPRFRKLKGKVLIPDNIKFRMIGLGYPGNSMKSSRGEVFWENNGGIVQFNGSFGSNPDFSLKISANATVEFGNNCSFGQNNFISATSSIVFGNDLLSSWDNQFFDHDFHQFYSLERKALIPHALPILIQDKVFIGSRCTILKGTSIPFRAVVGSNTVLNKNYGNESGTLIYGNPALALPKKITRVINEPLKDQEHKELTQL